MGSVVRTGVSIPKDVLELIEKYMQISGARSRSRVLTMAVKSFVGERLSLEENREILGVIVVVYNEERGDTVKRFIDVQHDYTQEIIATLHIHVTHEKCVEVIMVRGLVNRIMKLIGGIESIVGVEYTRFIPVQI